MRLEFSSIFVGILILIVLCILLPMPALTIASLLFEIFEYGTGYELDFVGAPGEASPGAVLAALVYVLICLLVSKLFHHYSKSSIAITIATGSFISSILVYAFASSMLWL